MANQSSAAPRKGFFLRCLFICSIVINLVRLEGGLFASPRYHTERVAVETVLLRADVPDYFSGSGLLFDGVSLPAAVDPDGCNQSIGYACLLEYYGNLVRAVLATEVFARPAISFPQKCPSEQSLPDEDSSPNG